MLGITIDISSTLLQLYLTGIKRKLQQTERKKVLKIFLTKRFFYVFKFLSDFQNFGFNFYPQSLTFLYNRHVFFI